MSQKNRFVHGSRKLDEFYRLMIERHLIYRRRFSNGCPPPWTEDPIMQRYKFCNVFRQFDRGTIALRNMIPTKSPDWLRLWNTVWYRLFNWRGNAKWFECVEDLRLHMTKRWVDDEILFTDAHMTSGRAGEPKYECMLDTSDDVFDAASKLFEMCLSAQRMERAFHLFTPFYAIGPFVAYEIVCDLRFVMELFQPTDTLTWANVGPGAKRGMQRLGLEPTLETMRWILLDSRRPKLKCEWPFELREIEHSLCEFDKYCRIDEGAKTMRRFRSTT